MTILTDLDCIRAAQRNSTQLNLELFPHADYLSRIDNSECHSLSERMLIRREP